ncbi:hypothetical protein ABE85_19675 [Mitsuaria sp. 7]|nr:hypothetical protein ABE85_19675 [Mitsuaria sp. 7]
MLVQAVFLSMLWMDHGWRRRTTAEGPRLTEVRLLPLPMSREALPVPRPELERRRPDMPRVPTAILVAPPEVAITAPSPSTSIQTVTAAAQPASGASAPLGNGRTTLNLALPKAGPASDPWVRMAEQIRNDERSHSASRTVESAIADAAGTLPIVSSVSTSGSGSKVIRQGSKCTRVYENRVAAMNPTDDRLKDAPAMMGNCFNK